MAVLSQTKDPNAVQPHLRKCFEAVHAIHMEGADCKMSNMVSAEKEVIEFVEPLYPKGSVEVWMGEIEKMMRLSVRNATVLALEDYLVSVRGEFCLRHASMVVIAVTQFHWTIGIEEGLKGEAQSCEPYYKKMLGQLQELSLLVRQKTTKLQGKVLSALVTLEVHGRDVVERLIQANVSKTTDFEWISQVKHAACSMQHAACSMQREQHTASPSSSL